MKQRFWLHGKDPNQAAWLLRRYFDKALKPSRRDKEWSS